MLVFSSKKYIVVDNKNCNQGHFCMNIKNMHLEASTHWEQFTLLFNPLPQVELDNSSSNSVLHCFFKHWTQTYLLFFEILAAVSFFFTRRNAILSRWRSQVFGTELQSGKFTLGGPFPHISRYCCIDSDLFPLWIILQSLQHSRIYRTMISEVQLRILCDIFMGWV